MATPASREQRVELLGTVQVLHEHLTTSLCQTVFQQTRTTERERRWSLAALASFWTEVILRAPQSLTQAIEEAATGNGAGWPRVQATPEAFSNAARPCTGASLPTSMRPLWRRCCRRRCPAMPLLCTPCVSTSRRSGSSTGRAWMRSPIGSSCCGRCARVSCPAV